MHASPTWPVLGLLLNALVWGLSWWPLREMQALGLHPLWSSGLTFGLALVVLSFWKPAAWQQLLHTPALWTLMIAAGLTNVGFNWAVATGDVVRVVLLFYVMPAWSIPIAWWVLGERPSRGALWRLALALVGVALVLKTPDTPWPWPESASDYLALMGGASFAWTNALLRRHHDTPSGARMIAMFAGGTALSLGLAVVWVGLGHTTLPTDLSWWPYVLGLGLTFLASNLALQYGAARLSAHTTALVMLSEVVFAALSSVALGVSELSARTLIGGGLIVLAAALSAWPSRPRPITPD
jgi:drug/metabolite transporter (DMT)-like permease